jgi:hypothetical protein
MKKGEYYEVDGPRKERRVGCGFHVGGGGDETALCNLVAAPRSGEGSMG